MLVTGSFLHFESMFFDRSPPFPDDRISGRSKADFPAKLHGVGRASETEKTRKRKVMGMQGTKARVGHARGQGVVSMDALSGFMSEVIDGQANDDMTVVPTRSIEVGLRMLRNGSIDCLLVRGDKATVAQVERVLGDIGWHRIWESSVPSSYVIASATALSLDEVPALLIDDVAMGRAGQAIREAMGDRRFVRYGCADGDESARTLREQPDAYMTGTAVVCSARACVGAGLRRLTQGLVDDGAEDIEFMVIALDDDAASEKKW